MFRAISDIGSRLFGSSRRETRIDGTSHWVSLGDQELSMATGKGREALRELLCEPNRSISPERIRGLVEQFSRLDPDFGKKGHGFRGAIETIRTLQSAEHASALEVVFDAYERMRDGKNLAIVRHIGDTPCKNARETLREAVAVLTEVYDREIAVVGKVVGLERQHWDLVETPYLTASRGVWNRDRTATRRPIGKVEVREEGFKIGSNIEVDGYGAKPGMSRPAVVIDAAHAFHGLGQGTARVIVRFLDVPEVQKIVPWVIKRVPVVSRN